MIPSFADSTPADVIKPFQKQYTFIIEPLMSPGAGRGDELASSGGVSMLGIHAYGASCGGQQRAALPVHWPEQRGLSASETQSFFLHTPNCLVVNRGQFLMPLQHTYSCILTIYLKYCDTELLLYTSCGLRSLSLLVSTVTTMIFNKGVSRCHGRHPLRPPTALPRS